MDAMSIGDDSLFQRFRFLIAWAIVFAGLYFAEEYNYLLFHSLAEIFSVIVASGIFMIAFNSRKIIDNDYLMLLGIAYLFVGFIDLFHTLTYTGMGVIKGYGVNLPTQLWIVGRYVESISLLIAPLFVNRKLNLSGAFTAYLLSIALVFVTIFYWHIFPACFVKDAGLTPFKIGSEYVICGMLVVAAYTLIRKKDYFEPKVTGLLIASIVTTILSELAFTLYAGPYGFFNAAGHYLKIISFYCIYKAVIVTGIQEPAKVLFRKLEQSEEGLRSEREKLLSILESMQDGVYIADQAFQLHYANPALRRTFGDPQDRKCYEYLYQRTTFCPWCRTKEVFAGMTVQWEMDAFHGTRTYDLVETPLKNPDGTVSKLAILRDITKRKQAEEIVNRDKQTMERLVKEKTANIIKMQEEMQRAKRLSDIGTLAATIAHELRNPLAALSMAAENIKRKAANAPIERQLQTIEKKITEGNQIIDNLLFYTRIKKPRYEVFPIGTLFEECITLAERQAKKKIRWEKSVDAITDLSIEADPLQMKELFSNILNNACEAIAEPEGVVSLAAFCHNGSVSFVVKDSGSGIKEEHLAKITEPFFTTKARGTGLGLSVCRQIVDIHRGTIAFVSEVEKGTTVTVTVPVKREAL